MPALLTRMSSFDRLAAAAFTLASSVTSMYRAVPRSNWSASDFAASKFRSATTTSAPARSSSRQVAAPMPLAPPVTSAALFFNPNASATLSPLSCREGLDLGSRLVTKLTQPRDRNHHLLVVAQPALRSAAETNSLRSPCADDVASLEGSER